MLLSEYQELPFGPQMALLARDGIPLLSRLVGQEQRVLFSFSSYYVETGWDGAGGLKFIRSFAHTNGLEPYLTQLDWHELV